MRFSATDKRKASGQALVEYVLPIALILIASGVLATSLDLNSLMGKYFMAAHGETSSTINARTYNVTAMPMPESGATGTGMEGFNDFGQIQDGDGQDQGKFTTPRYYTDSAPRTGARPVATSTEYAFP